MDASIEEQILSELRALRQEVRELRALLGSQAPAEAPDPPAYDIPGGARRLPPAPPAYDDPGGARRLPPDPPADGGSWLLEGIPEGLRKRVQPLMDSPPPLQESGPRARWLLEFSENVEDFVRYEGEDWPGAEAYLDKLQQLQTAWGLQRLTPREGDEVDPRYHLVLQSLPNAEKRDQVARCARAGFVLDGEILRRAEVVVYL